ncbi:MAG: helix-turn-helix domain-containing protein [Prolixibacteraceae bacterium]
MKERIKQFIDYKGISAGDLASALDVQRSNISHVLNGRNKPGANFIEKLLLTFPDLNARWLLTGKGQMINGTIQENSNISSSNPQINSGGKVSKEVSDEIQQSERRSEFAATIKSTESILVKVILLYSDGSFKSYNPVD